MSPQSAALFERCAHALHVGHPEARQQIVRLFSYLPFEIASETSILDPTPEEIDRVRAPRLGPAYLAFQAALDKIADPDIQPPKDYATYIVNKIRRGIRTARQQDYHVFGPSPRTKSRYRREGKFVAQRDDIELDELDERTNQWLDDTREEFDELALSDRERRVVTMLRDGYSQQEVADILNMCDRTVRRIKTKACSLALSA